MLSEGGDKGAMPPDQEPKVPSSGSTRPRLSLDDVTRHAESWAKVVVAVSFVTYCLGFLIAVQHYGRFAVPVRYIDHVTFLGAGVVFVFMNGVAAVAGWIAVHSPLEFLHREPIGSSAPIANGIHIGRFTFSVGALVAAVVIGVLLFCVAAVPMIVMTGWPPTTLWPLLFAYVGGLVLRLKRLRQVRAMGVISYLGAILTVILGFSTSTFPSIPAHYGGGRPRYLGQISIPAAPGLPAHVWWMKEGCRFSDATAPLCRMFFRVYETTEFLFVAITEVDGECTTGRIVDKLALVERATCGQRISNASIPRLESIVTATAY